MVDRNMVSGSKLFLQVFVLVSLYHSTSSICNCIQGASELAYGGDSQPCQRCFNELSTTGYNIKILYSISSPIEGLNESEMDEGSGIPNGSVAGRCHFCSFFRADDFATKSYVTIYENGSLKDLCEPNSGGFFCSECNQGYHHNMANKCVECGHVARDWVLFVLSQFLPITLFFILLLLGNISLVSGPLNSSIFFAQMVTTTMNLHGNGVIPLANITNSSQSAHGLTAAYQFVYGPWNLDFFAPFTDNLCLFRSNHYSVLYYFSIRYAVALYPLILVGIIFLAYWVSNRNMTLIESCRRRLHCNIRIMPNFYLSSRNTLASFVLLAYTKFSFLSVILFTPDPLYDFKGNIEDWVLLYDPNVSILEHQVAIAFIVLIMLFFILLLPTVLLLFRYRQEARCCYFLDNLLEPFQAPFKQGCDKECCAEKKLIWKFSFKLHDYRWVPSIYFVLRILLLCVYLGTESDFIKQFVYQQVVCLIAAFFFLFIRPYPKDHDWINKLDVFMFLLLAFINTISMYQYYLAINSEPLSKLAFAVQYILLYVPAIWITAYTINGIYKRVINYKKGGQTSNGVIPLVESTRLEPTSRKKSYETILDSN